MQLILPIVAPFDKLLEKSSLTGTLGPYRPSAYCITERIPEGILLFNNLTKAMALLSEAEWEQAADGGDPLPELVGHGFFVPIDHDDKKLCRQMRAVAKMLLPASKKITGYTIFTTTDCNARCFYCFEKNARRIPMSRAVAEKAASFIVAHCGGKTVALSWFGGEPLYNREAIDIICTRLREKGVAFRSSMVSNGYLFDEETVRTALEDWQLEKVQITLDGTEEVYNRAKAYIYKGVNAFERVISNIHLLLGAGIRVSIRLNIDIYNADNLLELATYLAQEFQGEKNLNVYVHPLFGDTLHFGVDDPSRRAVIYEKIAQIQQLLEKGGLCRTSRFTRVIKTSQCMADNPQSLTILPTGQLGKCEHCTDEYFVGHLDTPDEMDQAELAAFQASYPEIEECNSCPLYPDCFRLARCHDPRYACTKELRENWQRKIRAGMKATFYSNNGDESATC